MARARLYVAAGADCVYPLMAPPEVFPVLREGIDGPLNMAAGPDKESVAELARLGATRITFGPEMQRYAMGATGELAARPRVRSPTIQADVGPRTTRPCYSARTLRPGRPDRGYPDDPCDHRGGCRTDRAVPQTASGGAFASPEEAASCVAYLAGDDARFFAGSNVIVDSCWTAQ